MSDVIGTMIAKLQLDIENFSSNLSKVQSDIEATGKKFDGLSNLGSGITDVGKTLTTSVTLPVVGLGAAAVKTAADFEQGMSKVQALSGATSDEMSMLKDKALEMGAKTKYSAGESADAFTYMAQAGWNAGQMADGIGGIMSLAASDGLDLASTSEIVTSSLVAFGMQAKDAAQFADVLAVASSATNTNVSEMGEAFKYAAPVAGTLGFSVQDTSVALGLMANAGIKASTAGTTLRAALSNMVKPTDAQQKIMDQYNLSLTNSDGSMKSLNEVMLEMRDRFSGLTEAQQATVAATLFGDSAMSGMLAVINASDDSYQSLQKSINESAGTADKMAATMQDNLKGNIEQLTGALETLAIKAGDILIPALKDVVNSITGVVDKLSNMDQSTISMIMKIAMVAAAVGPVLLIVGKLISTFVTLQKAFTAIRAAWAAFSVATGTALGPVLLIIAGIVAFIAIIKHLWDTNEEFRNNITATWNKLVSTIKPLIEQIGASLKSLWDNVLQPLLDFLMDVLAPIFEGVFNQIANIIQTVVQVISGILDILVGIFTGDFDKISQGVMSIFGAIGNFLVETLNSWWTAISGVLDTFLGLFGTTFEGAMNGIKDFFIVLWNCIKDFFVGLWQGLVNTFKGILDGIKNLITTIFNGIKTYYTTVWNGIKTIFTTTLNAIKTVITTVFNAIKSFIQTSINGWKTIITTIWNAIKTFFSTTVSNIKNTVVNTFNALKTSISNVIGNVKDTIVNGLGKAVSFITGLPKQALTWGKDIIMGIVDGIKGAIDKVGDAVSGVADKIKSFLGFSVPEDGPLSNFETYMPDMIEGLVKTLNAAAPALYDTVESVAGTMSGILKNTSLTASVDGSNMSAADGSVGSTSRSEQTIKDNGNGSGDVIIENITVRDDEDIDKVTKGIYNKNDKSLRGMGRRNL